MSKSDGKVIIDTLIDTDGFDKGVNTMQKRIGGLGGAVKKLGTVIAATFAVGKIIQFGKECIELGSDLQEVQNVVDVVFTTMSDKVDEFAKNAAEAAGLSETMAKRYTGTFGAMAKAFNFAEDEAFNMSTSLTQLAGDVASFYNITQDEAYTKLKSVFTGETETLKDLGVVMTQNALDAYAMANGYGMTTKQMTEQQKVALRYKFVLDQLSAASGDFQRTSDGWANQIRILRLNIDSLKANVGQGLINIFTPAIKVLNTVISRLATAAKYFKAFTELFVGKQTAGGGGSPGEIAGELSDLQSGYEGVADATEEAAKANKTYLSGLDEVNTYSSKNNDMTIGGIDLSGIENAAEESIESMKTADELVEELEKKFPKLVSILKSSIEKLKGVFEKFSVGDFFGAGEDVSGLVLDIFSFVSEAIENVDWDELGKKAGDFLAGIDWIEIIKEAIKLRVSIWKIIAEVWLGAFETAPFETAFITAIAAMKFTGLGNILKDKIVGALPKSITLSETLALTIPLALFFKTTTEEGAKDYLSSLEKFNKSDFKNMEAPDWLNVLLGLGGASVGLSGKFFANDTLKEGLLAEWPVEEDFATLEEYETAVAEWSDKVEQHFIDSQKIPGIEYDEDGWNKGLVELKDKIDKWWNDEIVVWWNDSVAPWFTKEKWDELGNNIKTSLSQTWDEIKTDTREKWDNIKTTISNTWENIKNKAQASADTIKKSVTNAWENLKTKTSTTWNNIKTSISNTWANIKTKVSTFAESVKTKVVDAWNSLKTKTSNIWNSIITAIKNPINKIIGAINKMIYGMVCGINDMIGALNSLSFTIPDWIPGLGGSSFGLNIGYVSAPYIPYLASGAVIPPNAPFMAMLGDQKNGRNLEMPEALLRKVVREESGGGRSGGMRFTAQLNRRVLFDEFIEEAKIRQMQTGKNLLELV